jgi:hypothetical protein
VYNKTIGIKRHSVLAQGENQHEKDRPKITYRFSLLIFVGILVAMAGSQNGAVFAGIQSSR